MQARSVALPLDDRPPSELLMVLGSVDPVTAASFIVVLLFAFFGIFAGWLAPFDPNAFDVARVLAPPGHGHLFGTDELGRDVASRMIYGARVSLTVGIVAVGLSTVIGTAVGAIAGYYGGLIDAALMRFVDIMLCFPTFFLILAVIAYLDQSLTNIMIVIGLTSWMGTARLVRAEFLTLREREFVLGARALGASNARIIIRHIIPNAIAPVIVTATLGMATAILTESALSFLGLGAPPPTASWGNILASGKDNIYVAWWLTVFPGCAIFLATLAYNLIGEWVRDVTNPRTKYGR